MLTSVLLDERIIPQPAFGNAIAFSSAFPYHWLYASGGIIGSYYAANKGRGSPPVSYRWKLRFSHPNVASTE